MSRAKENLAEVLREATLLLSRADNDFSWSSWDNAEQALAEISEHIATLCAAKLPPKMELSVLFAPTGPLQEVSISSGWGEEFLDLASRFDRAVNRAYRWEPHRGRANVASDFVPYPAFHSAPHMSFRQPKSHRHVDDRAWRAWLARHEAELKAAGLPPGVMLSHAHWIDFLQNGCLERHSDADDGFVFDQLSAEQMSRLLALLEASPDSLSQPMVHSLRQRLRHTSGE